MNPAQSTKDYVTASLWGSAASGVSHSMAYPFEVVKIRQQLTGAGISPAVKALWQENGAQAFYKGFLPKIGAKLINGCWVYPTIKAMLAFLKENTSLSPVAQQAATGTAVAAISVAVTNPLDRAKVDAIAVPKQPFSVPRFLQTGWQGACPNFVNGALNHSMILIAQKYFQPKAATPPTLVDHVKTGGKVAAVLTAVTAFTDPVATKKIGTGAPLTEIIAATSPQTFVRGLLPNFCSRFVRSAIVAGLMDKLKI